MPTNANNKAKVKKPAATKPGKAAVSPKLSSLSNKNNSKVKQKPRR